MPRAKGTSSPTFRTRHGKMLTDADGMPVPTVAERRRREEEEREGKRVQREIERTLERLLKEGKYLIEEFVRFTPRSRKGMLLMTCSLLVPRKVVEALRESAVRARMSPEDFLRALLKTNYDEYVQRLRAEIARKKGKATQKLAGMILVK